jgi:hypothetical protein
MRRLALAVIALLLAVAGAYTAFWFFVAGRIEDGIRDWADSVKAQNIDATWRAVAVGGYPLAFRIELREARLREAANAPRGGEVRMPLLTGSARPWNFRLWRLSAPEGLTATAGPADAPAATLTARRAEGSVAVADGGGAHVSVGLAAPSIEAGPRLTAREAVVWLTFPPHPPQNHTEPALGLALQLRELNLPAVPAPFRNPLDEIAFGATVMGPIQPGSPREAAAAWRDAGGTLELDHLSLRWGGIAATGSGTLALDPELQPEGAFSGAVQGYDELLAALAGGGQIRPNEAGLARLALGFLAKPGPDGKPQIATSFTIQNGEMRLGPAKLGKAPRIPWE